MNWTRETFHFQSLSGGSWQPRVGGDTSGFSRADSALTHLSVVGNLLVQLWRSESSQTTQTDGSKHKTATSHQSTDTFTDNKNRPVSVSLVIFLIQAVLTEKRLSYVFMSQNLQIKTHISLCCVSVCGLISSHGDKCLYVNVTAIDLLQNWSKYFSKGKFKSISSDIQLQLGMFQRFGWC